MMAEPFGGHPAFWFRFHLSRFSLHSLVQYLSAFSNAECQWRIIIINVLALMQMYHLFMCFTWVWRQCWRRSHSTIDAWHLEALLQWARDDETIFHSIFNVVLCSGFLVSTAACVPHVFIIIIMFGEKRAKMLLFTKQEKKRLFRFSTVRRDLTNIHFIVFTFSLSCSVSVYVASQYLLSVGLIDEALHSNEGE